jgi:hypothetical protein
MANRQRSSSPQLPPSQQRDFQNSLGLSATDNRAVHLPSVSRGEQSICSTGRESLTLRGRLQYPGVERDQVSPRPNISTEDTSQPAPTRSAAVLAARQGAVRQNPHRQLVATASTPSRATCPAAASNEPSAERPRNGSMGLQGTLAATTGKGNCSNTLPTCLTKPQTGLSTLETSLFAAYRLQHLSAGSNGLETACFVLSRSPLETSSTRSLPTDRSNLAQSQASQSTLSTSASTTCRLGSLPSGSGGLAAIRVPTGKENPASRRKAPHELGLTSPGRRVRVLSTSNTRADTDISSRSSSSSQTESESSSDSPSISRTGSGVSSLSDRTYYGGAVSTSGLEFGPALTRGGSRTMPRNGPAQSVGVPPAKFGIGMETEFLLRARQASHKVQSLKDFARIVAKNHNAHVEPRDLWMYSDVGWFGSRSELNEWALIEDETIARQREPCKPFPF